MILVCHKYHSFSNCWLQIVGGMKPLTSRVTLLVSMETLDTAPHSRHRDPSRRQSRIRRGRGNTQHHPCQVQHTLYTRVYSRVFSLDMDSGGDKSGSGGKSRRGDILRGILKIRRKRNTSVSKAPSRGGYPSIYYYLSMYLLSRLASITMSLVCSMFVQRITFLDVECVTAVQVFPHCKFLHSFIPPSYEGERKKNGLILMKSSTARSVRTIFWCFPVNFLRLICPPVSVSHCRSTFLDIYLDLE